MKNVKLFCLLNIPGFLLSGCVGTWISGHHGNISADYPDIRSVPSLEEARKDRGLHAKDESKARQQDLQHLEQQLKKAKTRDQILRQDAFLPEEQSPKAGDNP